MFSSIFFFYIHFRFRIQFASFYTPEAEMKRRSIEFFPSEENVELIRMAADRISPDEYELQNWFETYVNNHELRLATDLSITRENINIDSSVLEIGSIPLLLTTSLDALGYNVTGVDIEPERFSESVKRNNLSILKCNIEQESIPTTDNSFDAVVFNEIFEHLRINPIFTFKEIRRIMKPHGKIMISTPNLKSLTGIYNWTFKDKSSSCSSDIYEEYMKLEKIGHMGHVREYTPTEISEFLSKVGFKVEEVLYRGRYDTNLSQGFARMFPRLRPFMTLVATPTEN